MGGSNLISLFVCILAFGYLATPSAEAWSNGGYSADQSNPDYGTHDWIAEMALTVQVQSMSFLRTTYHAEFLLGTEAPDNPDFIGDTTNHHVYYYSSGALQDGVCAGRAAQVYDTALDYLRAGDFHSAAFDIGVMTHYVSDVGVFGHTMGAQTDWGAETHHSDYENKVESMLALLPSPSSSLGDSDAYSATIGLAQKITFGDGKIKPNTWMDANYDWTDPVFESSARDSLNVSVSTVAAVINHLVKEAGQSDSHQNTTQQVPQKPTSLSAIADGSRVVLSWTAPASDGGPSIDSYLIYRGTDLAEPVYLAEVPASDLTWIDESLSRGVTYHYWIASHNSVGSSAMSVPVTIALPKGSDSLILPAVISAASLLLALIGGTAVWRLRRRARLK